MSLRLVLILCGLVLAALPGCGMLAPACPLLPAAAPPPVEASCPHPVAVPLPLPRVHTLEQLNAFAIELELAREAERARGDCYQQRTTPLDRS